jgi:hypothetical protein
MKIQISEIGYQEECDLALVTIFRQDEDGKINYSRLDSSHAGNPRLEVLAVELLAKSLQTHKDLPHLNAIGRGVEQFIKMSAHDMVELLRTLGVTVEDREA